MLTALCSQCLRDVRSRLPFVKQPSNLMPSLASSRVLSQSRHLHVGVINPVARNGTLAPQESVSTVPTAPESDAKKRKATQTKKTYTFWSKDELDRLKYLFSDGKNPTILSVAPFFPGRSRDALVNQMRKVKVVIPRKMWSTEEEDRLLEMHNTGATTLEMLKDLPGRTQDAIVSRLVQLRPASYFIDRKRMVSSLVMGEESHGSKQGELVIITRERHKKATTYWTEEEDDILKRLVQNAKERSPDRWRHELSRILSDPMERRGLDMTRNQNSCIIRLKLLETRPFISKGAWTNEEDTLLMMSVYSQLGIQMNSTSNPGPSSTQEENRTNDEPPLREGSDGTKSKLEEKRRWPEISPEQMKAVDWRRVALDVGARSAKGCQQRISSHFMLKKGKHWTKEEVERMREGLRQYGRDWEKVATVVGTKAPSQVEAKYDRSVRQMK